MIYQLVFNIDNKYNKCPEFVGWITALLPCVEESSHIVINFHHESVGNKRSDGYCVRHKTYHTELSIDTDLSHYNPDAYLENLIKRVNDHTAKITQEMHELNFTSIYAEHSGLKYHLSNPCRRATSFKKLLGYGEADFKTKYATYEAAQKVVDADITKMLSRPFTTTNKTQQPFSCHHTTAS